jgi:hypothetical protein
MINPSVALRQRFLSLLLRSCFFRTCFIFFRVGRILERIQVGLFRTCFLCLAVFVFSGTSLPASTLLLIMLHICFFL